MEIFLTKSLRVLAAIQLFIPPLFPFVILQGCLYVPVLVLLFVETEVCSDVLLRSILIVCAVFFASRLVFNMMMYVLEPNIYKISLSKARNLIQNNDEDVDPDVRNHIHRRHLFTYRAAILLLMVCLVFFGFVIATLVKISIPWKYSAQCLTDSASSKAILIATVGPIFIVQALSYVLLALYLRNKEITQAASVLASIIIFLAGLIQMILLIWVSARLSVDVWRRNGLNVYDFVTISAILPLTRML